MRKFINDRIYRVLMIVLVALIAFTTRKTWVNRHILEAYHREGKSFIAGLWHNNILCFTQPLGGMGLAGMISQSRDGENIAYVCAFFGLKPVRGSTARGALGATRALLRALNQGGSIALTPDGPRGPRYVMQPGITALAGRAGVPIVPMACAASRMIEFNSWDRMKLPLPFSRVIYYVGDPIWPEGKGQDEAATRQRVQYAMLRAEVIVDQYMEGGRIAREPALAEVAGEGVARKGGNR